MNKFEQLIEFVINDEDAKARELFHDIVVEKSRQIYENLMAEEAVEEAEGSDDLRSNVLAVIQKIYDGAADGKEMIDDVADELGDFYDEVKQSGDKTLMKAYSLAREEGAEAEGDSKRMAQVAKRAIDMLSQQGVDEGMGGDAADDLIDEVEMEEESDINMEEEGDDEEAGAEEVEIDVADEAGEDSDEPATKDDIMDLETKLDELMAEFEQLMGDQGAGDGDDMGADEGGDAIEMDDTEEMMPEMGMMEEGVDLKAAPKPTTSEEGAVNKKSVVAANSGAAGMASKPVSTDTAEEKGRKAPDAKDMISDFQNKAGAGMKDQKAAPKPVTSQASGVNTKSPLPGRKG